MADSTGQPQHHAFLEQAKKNFAFLESLGFQKIKEYEGTYASFKDGFYAIYQSQSIELTVQYFDLEFEVLFKREAIAVDYLFLDLNFFANASGHAGCMFPLEKLPAVIDSAAQDIANNYRPILLGEAQIWQKIIKLVNAPKEKPNRLP